MMGQKMGLRDEEIGQDAELDAALKNFRTSVHAWGEAEYSRPRQPQRGARMLSWRVATGFALGCVLAAVGVSGGLLAHHNRQAVPVPAVAVAVTGNQQVAAEPQQSASVQDEDLMAKVNSDVSRQVPRAMEPLAQLMDDDELQ